MLPCSPPFTFSDVRYLSQNVLYTKSKIPGKFGKSLFCIYAYFVVAYAVQLSDFSSASIHVIASVL